MARIIAYIFICIVSIISFILMYKKFFPEPLPHLDPEEWWGPKELKTKHDVSLRPFKVKFDDEMIADLKARLKRPTRFAKPLEGVAFQYGFNTDQLQPWLKYWAEEYPFKERENFLNQLPQYKTNIQGLDLHFIRVKPKVPATTEIVPLLIVHGWPGSVREFYEAIPLLTKRASDYDFAFEVIVPSLPGFGFSDAAVRPGLGALQAAVILRNLMHRLGHKKFYVQGGDWGSMVTSHMATLFSEDVLGYHTNMAFTFNTCALMQTLIGSVFPSLVVEESLADRLYPLSSTLGFIFEESGYFHIQATKPDTIGVSLQDSPAGLLSYILEKFSTATNREYRLRVDGGLHSEFSKEQLLDNLMIYWTTNSITTTMRFYLESASRNLLNVNLDTHKTIVPTWALQARNEIIYQPPHMLRMKYPNLLNTTVLDYGGHFIALELPEVYAADVFKAVQAFREWRKINIRTEL